MVLYHHLVSCCCDFFFVTFYQWLTNLVGPILRMQQKHCPIEACATHTL